MSPFADSFTMIQQTTESFPVYGELSARAMELGAPSWLCDARHKIIAEPAGEVFVEVIRQSSILREFIENFAAGNSLWTELFPGFFLLGLHVPDGLSVSMILAGDVLNQPGFLQIINQVSPEPASVRSALAPLIQPNQTGALRIAAALRHFHADLTRLRENQEVAQQFNSQLLQSFEEASVLFKTAQIINSPDDPASAVRRACDEFAQTFSFGWMAIWFSNSHRVAPSLAGRLTQSGKFPSSRENFISQLEKICATTPLPKWTEVLEPAKSDFAAMIGSEILVEPISREGVVVGLLVAGNKTGHDPEIASSEILFVRAMANYIAVFHENTARLDEQRAQFIGTLHALAGAIDAKDPYTRGHSQRVSVLGSKMANLLRLPPIEVERYRIAGLLHDIGKIGVPESILQKCGALTQEEFAQIKKHPQIGFNILKDVPSLEQILPGVLHHHERWDGLGYPAGLHAEQIPLIARCLAFADTFDAMSSSRSYRRSLPREHTLSELKRSASTQFDPALVDVFLSIDFADFDELLLAVAQPSGPTPEKWAAREAIAALPRR